MATKRKKGGRPRKQGVPREASGRVCRKHSAHQTEQAAVNTVLETRQRMYGLTEKQARDPMSGSAIGRLYLHEHISINQYHAASKYLEVRSAYQRAIAAPSDGHDPRPEWGSGHGTLEDFCRAAKANYAAMREVIQQHMQDTRSPNGSAALDVILVKDKDAHHLVGDLRLVLNVLKRHFFDDRRKAA